MTDTLKLCTKCQRTQHVDSFHRNASRADGRQAQCKSCKARSDQRWRAENIDHDRERKRTWYQDNREHCTAYNQDWHALNRKHRSDYDRERRRERPEHGWQKDYRHRCGIYGIAPVIHPFTKAELTTVWGNRCVECDAPDWQLDHIIPVAAGGEHSITNCRPLCGECNRTKLITTDRRAIADYRASR